MAKRANGEGNIRKRKDGKWLVTYPTGLYTDKGKREYVYRYCDTQAEAAEILRQLQAEKAMGVSQSKATVKTGEWMEKWIEGKAKGKKPQSHLPLLVIGTISDCISILTLGIFH